MVCVSQHALRQTPPPLLADGYCCGRYASYWNAFLYLTRFISDINRCIKVSNASNGFKSYDLTYIKVNDNLILDDCISEDIQIITAIISQRPPDVFLLPAKMDFMMMARLTLEVFPVFRIIIKILKSLFSYLKLGSPCQLAVLPLPADFATILY